MTIKFRVSIADKERASAIEERINNIYPNAIVSSEDSDDGLQLQNITLEFDSTFLSSICLAFFHAGIKFGQEG
jgi:hypothetical protein